MLRNDAHRPRSGTPDAENPSKAEAFRHYQRGRFVARLPVDNLYTPSHAWLCPNPGESSHRYRVGLTKFATRMLGELVEIQMETQPGAKVCTGDILGSIEGFKALSDLYCVGEGIFVTANPALTESLEPVTKDPHREGWLYAFDGEPAEGALDVEGYCSLLDQTIDRIMASEKQLEEDA